MNPYKKILPSKIGLVGEDTIQIIISFTINEDGVDYSYTPDETGITIIEIGEVDYKFSLDDLLLVPGTMKLSLYDSKGIFDSLINDERWEQLTSPIRYRSIVDKKATVSLLVNGAEEYVGKIQEGSIEYNKGLKTCNFTVDCDTTIINKKMVYDDEGVALDPFGYGTGTVVFKPITQIISDIYKLANHDLTLEVFHNWNFKCLMHPLPNIPFFEWHYLSLTNLSQDIIPLYQSNKYGVQTTGDILRKLAIDWGCFTGMLNLNKAFFRQLYTYDATYSQALGKVLQHTITYPIATIDYVRTHLNFTVAQDIENQYPTTLYGTFDETYEQGEFTELDGKYLDREGFLGFYYNSITDNASSVIANEIGWTGYAVGVKDVNVEDNYLAYGDLLTKFYLKYKSCPQFTRIDKFLVVGISYDFLKGFMYEGKKYQIIEMKKRISQGLTNISAIYLGA